MQFTDRTEAGKLLARLLHEYKGKNTVVYAIPRGGIITGIEVARYLHAPLDIVITRKISHPYNPEYALAAVSESGYFTGSHDALEDVDEEWLKDEIQRQKQEILRRRLLYEGRKAKITPAGKIAIIIDDGIATGLSIRVAIAEIKQYHPIKIIAAVPVASSSAVTTIKKEADDCIAIEIPADYDYLGSVGAYYDNFPQISDQQVIQVLEALDTTYQAKKGERYATGS